MLEIAKHAAATSKYNAAVTSSIHSSINALDTLAVFYFGHRHSGSHEGAVNAVKGALTEKEFDDVSKQFSGLMSLKNQVEYQPDLMLARDANDAVKRASRIVSKVKEKLPDE